MDEKGDEKGANLDAVLKESVDLVPLPSSFFLILGFFLF
jgi:hypothetical protein